MEFHNKQLLDYALFAFERKELTSVTLNKLSITLEIKHNHKIIFWGCVHKNLDSDFNNILNILLSKDISNISSHSPKKINISYLDKL